ncbi:HD domain-containing protein [Arenimonas sp. MALMAid1274]|uniref:HD domain-containing protein n=1 Tax=Arenimonas sp. MALMAid1274 TaxID=3411630 RepID=UPI003B9EBDEC
MTPSPHARLARALHYAAGQHSRQRRKDADASPYINHPIALLHILTVEAGITDEDVLVAAVLHDVMEDCSGPGQMHLALRRAEIRDQFGPAVLALVEAVTDDKTLPKADRKKAQVEHAARLPYGARLIKLADKTANLRDLASAPPANWSVERLDQYYLWAAEVVAALRGTHALLEMAFDREFARQVDATAGARVA